MILLNEEIFFSLKKIPFPFRDENILMKLGNFARCYGNTIRRKAGNVKLKKKKKKNYSFLYYFNFISVRLFIPSGGGNIFIIDVRMITLHCAILYPVFLR